MAALLAYSRYIPRHALARAETAAALRLPHARGHRSVAAHDEDTVTLAVAAMRHLSLSSQPEGLYFATGTPPLLDKSNATLIGIAGGLRREVPAVDLVGLRSGIAALRCAWRSGGLAVLSDMRGGRPGSPEELEGGDGAAAFLFSSEGAGIAEVIGAASVSVELMDVWRVPGRAHAAMCEERFASQVLGSLVREALAELTRNCGFDGIPTTTLVSAPSSRFAATQSASTSKGQALLLQHRQTIGYCGAADPGMLLAAALDEARAGDTILLICAVGGAEVLLLRALQDGRGAQQLRRHPVNYLEFLTWRGELTREPARRPERASLSSPAAFRSHDWKYAFEGSRCRKCATAYLPPQRVCGTCGAADEMGSYRAADQPAHIAMLSTDTITDSVAPPSMAAVVDFAAGGRVLLELTDTAAVELKPGDPVELTFRRTYTVDDTPNYFWKARPAQSTLR